MNPYVAGPLKITRALALEFYAWTATNRRAAADYYAHEFISESHCETCGNRSHVSPCWRCAEETK